MLKSKWISCFENYLWIKNFWFSNWNWFKLFEFQYQHWMSNSGTHKRTHARTHLPTRRYNTAFHRELTAMLLDIKWCAVEKYQCHGWCCCCCCCMHASIYIHIIWKYGWASFHSIVCSSMCHLPFSHSMNIKKATEFKSSNFGMIRIRPDNATHFNLNRPVVFWYVQHDSHNSCLLPGLDWCVVCASALVFVECPAMSDDIEFLILKLAVKTPWLKLGISLLFWWFGLVSYYFLLFFLEIFNPNTFAVAASIPSSHPNVFDVYSIRSIHDVNVDYSLI